MYGQLSGILGGVLHDLGQDHRAAALLQAGREGAREAGDMDLLGWLFATESLIPLWNGDPAGALDLAEQGLAVAGSGGTRTVSGLYSRALAARARLALREPSHVAVVERELQAAHDILAKASGGAWDGDLSLATPFVFGDAHLSYCAGRAYLEMGDAKRGMEICAQAMTLAEGAAVKNYTSVALNQLNLAAGALILGDATAAAEQAGSALACYAGHNRNVVRRAAELRQALDPHRDLPAVAEYSALLADRARERRTIDTAP